MRLWVYTDKENRVLAVNQNDMEGNTGWSLCENAPIGPDDALTDEHGIALYKLENGEMVERTAEERERDIPEQEEEPATSDHDRIEALEQSIDLLISGEVE